MHRSLTALFRTLVVMAIGLCVVAIGLGRYVVKTHSCRRAAVARYQGVNGHLFSASADQPLFVDRETGRLVQVDVLPGDALEYSSCSPWRDERGQFQVVSRWTNRSGQKIGSLAQEFGLARYTLPEGELIDHVALEVLPIGEPCWVPGLVPRIVYVSGDGGIDTYSFEEADHSSVGEIQEHAEPQRVTWRTDPPGFGSVLFRDLIWPADPKLGGRLIASLSYIGQVDGEQRYLGYQLWWLELSGDESAIVAAGRLTDTDLDDRADVLNDEERFPNIARTAEGEPTLAYLRRKSGESRWELRVAPIAINPGTGTPVVGRDSSRGLAQGCLATAPTFSADGNWIYGFTDSKIASTLRRFSVARALARADGVPPRLGWADLAFFPPTRLVPGATRRHARW